jgi:peptidoglycan hydrolase CwlO-like protein
MPQSQAQRQLQKYDADIAVLQVEFKNLDKKIDTEIIELKGQVKDVSDKMDKHTESTQQLIRDFQESNVASHKEMSDKIAGLEKWRWMLIGAGIALGSLGYSGFQTFFMN